MSRATADDQLRFLLTCVKHSNNGKIDFVEVAKECVIVSKGAAAKRYERLMKANGIHPNGGPSEKSPPNTAKGKSKAAIAKAAAAKRQKIEGNRTEIKENEEEINNTFLRTEPNVFARNKPGPGNNYAPYVYPQRAMASPAPCFSHSHPLPMPQSQPQIQSYLLSSQVPQTQPTLPTPLHGAFWRSSLSRLKTATTTPRTYSQENASPATPMPYLLDEKTNSLFEDFCNSELFSQPMFQSRISVDSTSLKHQMAVSPPPVPQEAHTIGMRASVPQDCLASAEVGSEPQNSILIE